MFSRCALIAGGTPALPANAPAFTRDFHVLVNRSAQAGSADILSAMSAQREQKSNHRWVLRQEMVVYGMFSRSALICGRGRPRSHKSRLLRTTHPLTHHQTK